VSFLKLILIYHLDLNLIICSFLNILIKINYYNLHISFICLIKWTLLCFDLNLFNFFQYLFIILLSCLADISFSSNFNKMFFLFIQVIFRRKLRMITILLISVHFYNIFYFFIWILQGIRYCWNFLFQILLTQIKLIIFFHIYFWNFKYSILYFTPYFRLLR